MSDYRFVEGTLYRFHVRGQDKTVAASNDGTDVHVVPTDNTSENQEWIAVLDEEHNQTRFLNYGTRAFLEKNAEGNLLKAESRNPGNFQNFLAKPVRTGWYLKLIVGPNPTPVVVLFYDSDEWLGLAENPSTIYDIDVVPPPKE